MLALTKSKINQNLYSSLDRARIWDCFPCNEVSCVTRYCHPEFVFILFLNPPISPSYYYMLWSQCGLLRFIHVSLFKEISLMPLARHSSSWIFLISLVVLSARVCLNVSVCRYFTLRWFSKDWTVLCWSPCSTSILKTSFHCTFDSTLQLRSLPSPSLVCREPMFLADPIAGLSLCLW